MLAYRTGITYNIIIQTLNVIPPVLHICTKRRMATVIRIRTVKSICDYIGFITLTTFILIAIFIYYHICTTSYSI